MRNVRGRCYCDVVSVREKIERTDMAHETAIIEVKNSGLTASAALDKGVRIWHDEEAGRFDSASPGYIHTAPITTKRAAEYLMGSDDYEVNSGNSVVVPLVDESKVKRSQQKIRLTLTAAEFKKARGSLYLLTPKVKAALTPGLAYEGFTISKFPAARKAVAATTEGKASTKYRLVWESRFGGKTVSKKLHDSQAAARKAGVNFMNSPEGKDYVRADIEGVVVREGGSTALVTIERPIPDTVVVEVEVTVAKLPANPERHRAGYLVAFDYHH